MRYVISLGGSLIVPNEVDVEFLKSFRSLIIDRIGKGDEFIIVCGGGKTCRKYVGYASELEELEESEKDLLGIRVTQINAELVRLMFKKYAHDEVIVNPYNVSEAKGKIVIASGWKPGCSTDKDAVLHAMQLGSDKILNLSNVKYVYDKDPKESDAKIMKEIRWKDYLDIVGEEWKASMNAPFDPVASKLAEENSIKVYMMDGKDLENVKSFFNGEGFEGSVIY